MSCAVALAASMGCGGSASTGTLFGGGDGGADASSPGASGVVTADGGSTGEGGPGGSANALNCGSASCALPAESCCVYEKSSPPSYLCVQGGACPSGGANGAGTLLNCSGAANCPASTVCCVYENAARQPVSDCMAACPSNGAQLCDPSAANPGCAPNAPCSSANVTDWGIPNSYATCGGVGN